MTARLARVARWAGWTLLGLLAALGVVLGGVAAFAASSFGRPVVAGFLIHQVDAALAGRFALQGFEVLPRGGIEIHGLEVYDPDDHLVLQVSRARLFADLTRLRSRVVGVSLELEGPSVLLETEADGSVSLARAFAPTHPSPPDQAGPSPTTWTLRLTRLTVRQGEVWWRDLDGRTRLEASGVDLDAEGAYEPSGGFLELTTHGQLAAPAQGPFSLALAARLDGERLRVPLLSARLGATELGALGTGDLGRRSFRAAVTRLGLSRRDLAQLAPQAMLAEDLAATCYAESDGTLLTAALDARQVDGASGGSARAAVAFQLPPPGPPGPQPAGTRPPGGKPPSAVPGAAPPAAGLDLALAGLDPSRLLAQAPPGRITLTARGAVAGTGLADARGRLAVELQPSRLRQGELGPASLRATAVPGAIEVAGLTARLPGLSFSGAGRWREGGAVSGTLQVDADDLGRAGRNLAALLDVPLPPLGGRLSLAATLLGTAQAPQAQATLSAPLLGVGATRLEGAHLALEATGPRETPHLRAEGGAARALLGGAEVRAVRLSAGLQGGELSTALSGVMPGLGPDPVSLDASALLAPDRRSATVRALTAAWPGSRWALTGPALVTFDPGTVDRLELAEGAQRLAASGGLGPRGTVAARLEATRLDLSRLPRGLVPTDLGLAGLLTLDARVTGRAAAPGVTAHLSLEDGAARGLAGLGLHGDAAWDGEARRLRAELGLVRAKGESLDVRADLPLPLATARPEEPLSLTVAAVGWPLATLRQAAAVEAPAQGVLSAHATLGGTVAAPTLQAELAVEEGRWDDLGPYGLTATLGALGGDATLDLAARQGGAPLATLHATAPLEPAALLADPAGALRGWRTTRLSATLEVPGARLAPYAGRLGLPDGLAGTLSAHAELTGSVGAPRGTVQAELADLLVPGWPRLGGSAALRLEPTQVALEGRGAVGGTEALRLAASLQAPPERLAERSVLRTAPLRVDAEIPTFDLARAVGPEPAMAGTLGARLVAIGTLAAPEVRLDGVGRGLALGGRPLGNLTAMARSIQGRSEGTLTLAAAPGGTLPGGTLAAEATLQAAPGLDTTAAALWRAPATLKAKSDRLDLGILPALLPGLVRTASGPLTVDLTAEGPLEALRPRGTIRLEGGRLAVSEYGDWTELSVDASIGEKTVEISKFHARRAAGQVSGQLSVTELGLPTSNLAGQLTFQKFTVARAGMELATLDFPATLTGTWTADLLELKVEVPSGTVRLPKKTPRTLQTLDRRTDIAVGPPQRRRAPLLPGGAAQKPFVAKLHLVVPGKLFVKSDAPTVNIEIKTDSTWSYVDGEVLADGLFEVVRGTVEPMSGRVFEVERGKVQFNGGSYEQGQLDVVAKWENPAALVTVGVTGPLLDPKLQLSSRPPLDDASIAMLIATGRTEVKAGTSDIGSVSGREAGLTAAGAVATLLFKEKLADKLPLDTVSLDGSAIRAGKYLTDKIFVAYARRLQANPEKGENPDEVKVEYQISKRWTLESTYGSAQTGGASLIWQRDY